MGEFVLDSCIALQLDTNPLNSRTLINSVTVILNNLNHMVGSLYDVPTEHYVLLKLLRNDRKAF